MPFSVCSLCVNFVSKNLVVYFVCLCFDFIFFITICDVLYSIRCAILMIFYISILCMNRYYEKYTLRLYMFELNYNFLDSLFLLNKFVIWLWYLVQHCDYGLLLIPRIFIYIMIVIDNFLQDVIIDIMLLIIVLCVFYGMLQLSLHDVGTPNSSPSFAIIWLARKYQLGKNIFP